MSAPFPRMRGSSTWIRSQAIARGLIRIRDPMRRVAEKETRKCRRQAAGNVSVIERGCLASASFAPTGQVDRLGGEHITGRPTGRKGAAARDRVFQVTASVLDEHEADQRASRRHVVPEKILPGFA